ncbi:hypothetical protein V2J09_022503 [Rumex salicifolius]
MTFYANPAQTLYSGTGPKYRNPPWEFLEAIHRQVTIFKHLPITRRISDYILLSYFSPKQNSNKGTIFQPFQAFINRNKAKRSTEEAMAGAQLLKRIPRIQFPKRHPKPAGSSSTGQESGADEALRRFISSSNSGPSTLSASGKASLQPKRTPMSNEEIEAILVAAMGAEEPLAFFF